MIGLSSYSNGTLRQPVAGKLVRSTGETYQCWWNALFKIFHSPPPLRSVKKSVYR